MEQIRASRGVCYGVNKHAVTGEIFEVDAGTAIYLVSIGHQRVQDETPVPSKPVIEQSAMQGKPAKKEK